MSRNPHAPGEQESLEEGQHFTFIAHKRELLKMTKSSIQETAEETWINDISKIQWLFVGKLTHGSVITEYVEVLKVSCGIAQW